MTKWNVVEKAARTVEGITFASKKEASRYAELKIAERAGEIADLSKGKRHYIYVNGVKVGWYTPDFEYLSKTGTPVFEEVKSSGTVKSGYYQLRKRLFEAYYSAKVTEVIR